MSWITEKSCSISGRNQRFPGLPSLLFSWYQGFSSQVGTADHLPLSSADVKNKLYFKSSMCLHGMHRGNITLLFKDSMIQRLMWSYIQPAPNSVWKFECDTETGGCTWNCSVKKEFQFMSNCATWILLFTNNCLSIWPVFFFWLLSFLV